jgi:hypothetical protein
MLIFDGIGNIVHIVSKVNSQTVYKVENYLSVELNKLITKG